MTTMFVGKLILFFCLAGAVFGLGERETDSSSTEPLSAPKEARALNTLDLSPNSTVTTSNSTVTTSNSTVTPTNSTVTPTNSTVTPTNSTVTPTDSTVTPTNSTVTPTNSTVTPTNTTVTPTNKTPTGSPTNTTTTGIPTNTTTTGIPTTKTMEPTTIPPSKPNPCDPTPCKGGSQCQLGYNSSVTCFCQVGQAYTKGKCEEAKVFVGSLTLTRVQFTKDMEDPLSQDFYNITSSISSEMKNVFQTEDATYIESKVRNIRKSSGEEARTIWSFKNTGVNAAVEIIFNSSSLQTDERVTKQIKTAISNCQAPDSCAGSLFQGAAYKETNLCNFVLSPCEKTSTTCTPTVGGAECKCQTGYISIPFFSKECKACESGKRAEGDKCVDCTFGYSGFNCNESWKLMLVIVGSVLGALLLISIILLPIVAQKKPKKSSNKSSKNAEPPSYISPYTAKGFGGSDSNNGGVANVGSGFAGIPKIPRAMSNSNNWNRGSNLEMTESGSRQALVPRASNGGVGNYQNPDTQNYNTRNPYQSRGQDNIPYQTQGQDNISYQSRGQDNPYQSRGQDNPYQSRGQDNPYQSRGQDNPYQSRGQDNPYQSRGQDNPYFTNDNGRRN
ncbi:hypothetical protein UPYG_G00141840 [Umbra pygmaea]|uniref:Mucin-13 n=1 Tax=Umbra pygmaea TaxID=75934 RepID=A0ABD0WVG9_UMBPY